MWQHNRVSKNVISGQAKNIYRCKDTKRKMHNCITNNFFKHTVVLTVYTYWLTIRKHSRVSNIKIIIPYMFLLVQYSVCTCLKRQKMLICGETVESADPVSLATNESLLFWGSISVISGNRFLIALMEFYTLCENLFSESSWNFSLCSVCLENSYYCWGFFRGLTLLSKYSGNLILFNYPVLCLVGTSAQTFGNILVYHLQQVLVTASEYRDFVHATQDSFDCALNYCVHSF